MKLTPWLVLLCLGVVSCSGSKSAQKVDESIPQIELSDADEFIENPVDEPFVSDLASEPMDDMRSEPMTDSVVMDSPVMDSPAIEDEAVTITEPAAPAVVITEPSSERTYTVQKNETLMLIAFKIYGDYEKWKELANYNHGQLQGGTMLKEGMTLKYLAPAEEFVWNPQGLPYLIRTGDTLGGISKNVYQTPNKWKLLWDNNRPLIKDPNKIFAGFTIYYLENGREVAGEI